jgi:hypothetical protein
VIEVLPAYPGDESEVIRCKLRHGTIYDTYICLSYVWGSRPDVSVIDVNGRSFHVQSNLRDFLSVARDKYPNQPFWIDAICIDQSNNLERNHQVQQMGQIYSRASDVISWLGNDEHISDFFRRTNRGSVSILQDEGEYNLTRNSYWTRAWITQEVLLARDVRFLAGTEELRLENLQSLFSNIDQGQSELAQLRPLLSQKSWNVRGVNLFRLLALFRNKECAVKRDRIFSLLSLSEENLNWVVDYDIPDALLFARIVQAQPADTMCLCSCSLLSSILDTRIFLQQESFRGPVNAEMVFEKHTTNFMNCVACNIDLPEHWSIPVPTYIFCLNLLCDKLRGHLYSDGQNHYLWYASAHKPGLEGINGENFQIHWGSAENARHTRVWLNAKGVAQLMQALGANSEEAGSGPFDICDAVWDGQAMKRFKVYGT